MPPPSSPASPSAQAATRRRIDITRVTEANLGDEADMTSYTDHLAGEPPSGAASQPPLGAFQYRLVGDRGDKTPRSRHGAARWFSSCR